MAGLSGDILSWLVSIVFLYWCLCTRVWNDYNFRCRWWSLLRFLLPFLVLKRVWQLWLPSGEHFWDPLGVQGKCPWRLEAEMTGWVGEGICGRFLWSAGGRTGNKGKPQPVVCYRYVDETGGLDLEQRRETEDLKITYLLFSTLRLFCWHYPVFSFAVSFWTSYNIHAYSFFYFLCLTFCLFLCLFLCFKQSHIPQAGCEPIVLLGMTDFFFILLLRLLGLWARPPAFVWCFKNARQASTDRALSPALTLDSFREIFTTLSSNPYTETHF